MLKNQPTWNGLRKTASLTQQKNHKCSTICQTWDNKEWNKLVGNFSTLSRRPAKSCSITSSRISGTSKSSSVSSLSTPGLTWSPRAIPGTTALSPGECSIWICISPLTEARFWMSDRLPRCIGRVTDIRINKLLASFNCVSANFILRGTYTRGWGPMQTEILRAIAGGKCQDHFTLH